MKKTAFALIVLILALALPARADVALDIKLNFFGPAAGKSGEANVATSFSLKSMRPAQPAGHGLHRREPAGRIAQDVQQRRISPCWPAPTWPGARTGRPSVMQVVQIDGRDYALVLTPLPRPGAVNFKVGVVEESEPEEDQKHPARYRDRPSRPRGGHAGIPRFQENSYFIAFYVQGRERGHSAKDVVRLAGERQAQEDQGRQAGLSRRGPGEGDRGDGGAGSRDRRERQGQGDPDPLVARIPRTDRGRQGCRQANGNTSPIVVDGAGQGGPFTVTVNFALESRGQGARRPAMP